MSTRNAVEYFPGVGVNANDVLFNAAVEKHSLFTLMSTTGAVQVLVSLDGVNFATAPLSMVDAGSASSTTTVIVTAPLRVYLFSGKFRVLRVTQNGATATAATLMAGNPGVNG